MAVHPTASIHPDAEVHPSCEIGPHAVIDGPARLGPNCRLGPAAIVLGNSRIGAGCTIHSHAVIGDVPQDLKFADQLTYCTIGDGCVIREGVTIHRACVEGESTIVGNGCYLMTNAHVAHDCLLADEVTLVSGALLGGHVQVGRKAIISGNAAVHQFVRIGELAMIGGVAKIVQDVPPFTMTDQEGAVVGLNAIGLKRAGVSVQERKDLRELLRIIYRAGLPFAQAVAAADDAATTSLGGRFVQFFQASSKRGFRRLTPGPQVPL